MQVRFEYCDLRKVSIGLVLCLVSAIGLGILLAATMEKSIAHVHAQQATAAVPVTPTAPVVDTCAVCKAKYCPSEVQCLRLSNLQLKAMNAQQAYITRAQQLPEFSQFQQAIASLNQECREVHDLNKWPGDVQCNINVTPVAFNGAPEPAPKAEPKTENPANPPKGDK